MPQSAKVAERTIRGRLDPEDCQLPVKPSGVTQAEAGLEY
jgi:hypothetical protein